MSFDPTNRELCPDGSCIGVIGADGRCKECGTVAQSATTHSRLRGMREPEEDVIAPFGADEQRDLCPDGSCIGVIGADGRCKECGRTAAETDAEDEAEEPVAAETGNGDAAGPVGGGDFDERQLCPDGACIGLIGPDGRCKECGASAK